MKNNNKWWASERENERERERTKLHEHIHHPNTNNNIWQRKEQQKKRTETIHMKINVCKWFKLAEISVVVGFVTNVLYPSFVLIYIIIQMTKWERKSDQKWQLFLTTFVNALPLGPFSFAHIPIYLVGFFFVDVFIFSLAETVKLACWCR